MCFWQELAQHGDKDFKGWPSARIIEKMYFINDHTPHPTDPWRVVTQERIKFFGRTDYPIFVFKARLRIIDIANCDINADERPIPSRKIMVFFGSKGLMEISVKKGSARKFFSEKGKLAVEVSSNPAG